MNNEQNTQKEVKTEESAPRMTKSDMRKLKDYLEAFIPRKELLETNKIVSGMLEKMYEYEVLIRICKDKLNITEEEMKMKSAIVSEEMKKLKEAREENKES